MLRLLKLFFLFSLSAFFFTWNIEALILLLNHQMKVGPLQISQIFGNLILYYGPLFFLFIGLAFFIVQFFAEKKYPIGFFNPPCIVYFFTFTIFFITLIMFLNYDYYNEFFSTAIRAKFNLLLLFHSLLIVLGTIFIFLKRRTRNWMQLGLVLLFILYIPYSKNLVSQTETVAPFPQRAEVPVTSPRKLKIVLMDGLSLDIILNLSAQQKLLNFNWIRQNGVVGRIKTISPNFDLTVLNTFLTGERPHTYQIHSNNRFRFRDILIEFDIFPRYILFRNATKLGLVSFYKKTDSVPLDRIRDLFDASHLDCFSMVTPPSYPIYSEKNLLKNSTFIQFFPNISKKSDRKIELVKKAFFLDDYLTHRIPNFKVTAYQYFLLSLPGLNVVTTQFYHYAHPQDFHNLSAEQILDYGTILEKYYLYYDSIVGKLIATMGEDEMLIILSSFEAEPLPLWRKILVNYIGKRDIYVYNSNTAPGLVLFYEKKALKKQLFLNTLSIYDIYPTLIYYTGFPLRKSLNGEVLRDIFSDRFILNNPIIQVARRP